MGNFSCDGGIHKIVLYDAYRLATDVYLAGCSCCPIPDYVIHFTTDRFGTPVYLRDEGWWGNHRMWVDKNGFEDSEATLENIPNLVAHYHRRGVPDYLLTKLEAEIKEKVERHRNW